MNPSQIVTVVTLLAVSAPAVFAGVAPPPIFDVPPLPARDAAADTVSITAGVDVISTDGKKLDTVDKPAAVDVATPTETADPPSVPVDTSPAAETPTVGPVESPKDVAGDASPGVAIGAGDTPNTDTAAIVPVVANTAAGDTSPTTSADDPPLDTTAGAPPAAATPADALPPTDVVVDVPPPPSPIDPIADAPTADAEIGVPPPIDAPEDSPPPTGVAVPDLPQIDVIVDSSTLKDAPVDAPPPTDVAVPDPHPTAAIVDVPAPIDPIVDVQPSVDASVDTPSPTDVAVPDPHPTDAIVDVPAPIDPAVDVQSPADATLDARPPTDVAVPDPLRIDAIVDVPAAIDPEVDAPPIDATVDTPPPRDPVVDAPPPIDPAIGVQPPTGAPIDTPPPTDPIVDAPPPAGTVVEAPLPIDPAVDSLPPIDATIDALPSTDLTVDAPHPIDSVIDTPPPTDPTLVEDPTPTEAVVDTPIPTDGVVNAKQPPTDAIVDLQPPIDATVDEPPPTDPTVVEVPPPTEAAKDTPPSIDGVVDSIPPGDAVPDVPPPIDGLIIVPPPVDTAETVPAPADTDSPPQIDTVVDAPAPPVVDATLPVDAAIDAPPPTDPATVAIQPPADTTVDVGATIDVLTPADAGTVDVPPLTDASPKKAAVDVAPLPDIGEGDVPPEIDVTVEAPPPPISTSADVPPSIDATLDVPPPTDTTADAPPPPIDTTADAPPPPIDTTADAPPPPIDIAVDAPNPAGDGPPPIDATLDVLPQIDTAVDGPPAPIDTAVDVPPTPIDAAVGVPPKIDATMDGPPPVDTVVDEMPPPIGTAVDVPPPIDTTVDRPPITIGTTMDVLPQIDTAEDGPPAPIYTAVDVPPPPIDAAVGVPPKTDATMDGPPPVDTAVDEMPPPIGTAVDVPPPIDKTVDRPPITIGTTIDGPPPAIGTSVDVQSPTDIGRVDVPPPTDAIVDSSPSIDTMVDGPPPAGFIPPAIDATVYIPPHVGTAIGVPPPIGTVAVDVPPLPDSGTLDVPPTTDTAVDAPPHIDTTIDVPPPIVATSDVSSATDQLAVAVAPRAEPPLGVPPSTDTAAQIPPQIDTVPSTEKHSVQGPPPDIIASDTSQTDTRKPVDTSLVDAGHPPPIFIPGAQYQHKPIWEDPGTSGTVGSLPSIQVPTTTTLTPPPPIIVPKRHEKPDWQRDNSSAQSLRGEDKQAAREFYRPSENDPRFMSVSELAELALLNLERRLQSEREDWRNRKIGYGLQVFFKTPKPISPEPATTPKVVSFDNNNLIAPIVHAVDRNRVVSNPRANTGRDLIGTKLRQENIRGPDTKDWGLAQFGLDIGSLNVPKSPTTTPSLPPPRPIKAPPKVTTFFDTTGLDTPNWISPMNTLPFPSTRQDDTARTASLHADKPKYRPFVQSEDIFSIPGIGQWLDKLKVEGGLLNQNQNVDTGILPDRDVLATRAGTSAYTDYHVAYQSDQYTDTLPTPIHAQDSYTSAEQTIVHYPPFVQPSITNTNFIHMAELLKLSNIDISQLNKNTFGQTVHDQRSAMNSVGSVLSMDTAYNERSQMDVLKPTTPKVIIPTTTPAPTTLSTTTQQPTAPLTAEPHPPAIFDTKVVQTFMPFPKTEPSTQPTVSGDSKPGQDEPRTGRNTDTSNDPCSGCIYVNERCLLPHPVHCHMYTECVRQGRFVRSFTRTCAMGSFFDRKKFLCVDPKNTDCPTDRCREPGLKAYSIFGQCKHYWVCGAREGGGIFAQSECCPDNGGFKDGVGCVADPNCTDSCHSEINHSPPAGCQLQKTASPMEYLDSRANIVRPCAPGTVFSETACTCVQDVKIERSNTKPGACECDPGTMNGTNCTCGSDNTPGNSTIGAGMCRPMLKMTFDGAAIEDKSNTKQHIGIEGVPASKTGEAIFNGDGRLVLWRYANLMFTDVFALSFRFKNTKAGPRYQTLISNCNKKSGQEPSFDIQLDTVYNEVIFSVNTYQSHAKIFKLYYQPKTWVHVELIYDGERIVGAVDGRVRNIFAAGGIETRPSPLSIGGCGGKGALKGLIDDIYIYEECIPDEMYGTFVSVLE